MMEQLYIEIYISILIKHKNVTKFNLITHSNSHHKNGNIRNITVKPAHSPGRHPDVVQFRCWGVFEVEAGLDV